MAAGRNTPPERRYKSKYEKNPGASWSCGILRIEAGRWSGWVSKKSSIQNGIQALPGNQERAGKEHRKPYHGAKAIERRAMRKNLKEARLKAGMTQQQVAEKIGII